MKLKKAGCLFMAAVLGTGLLAGCAATETSNTGGSTAAQTTKAEAEGTAAENEGGGRT